MDLKAVGDNESAKVALNANVVAEESKDCDIIMNGYRYAKEPLACYIGRNFAQEALFVREREKEACLIYKFDDTPDNVYDIPIFTDHRSLTDTDSSTLSSTQVSSQLFRA